MENSRLSSKLAGRLDLPGSSGVLSDVGEREGGRPARAGASLGADASCSLTVRLPLQYLCWRVLSGGCTDPRVQDEALVACCDVGNTEQGSVVQIKQEKDRQRKGAALMKTVSQARKAMASMNMLAEAMSSVGQGRSGDTGAAGAPGESACVVDGTSSKMPAEDGEWEVFKDMVCC